MVRDTKSIEMLLGVGGIFPGKIIPITGHELGSVVKGLRVLGLKAEVTSKPDQLDPSFFYFRVGTNYVRGREFYQLLPGTLEPKPDSYKD